MYIIIGDTQVCVGWSYKHFGWGDTIALIMQVFLAYTELIM